MSKSAPAFELVVTNPFDGFEKGQIISDPEKVAEILESENQGNVVKKPKG